MQNNMWRKLSYLVSFQWSYQLHNFYETSVEYVNCIVNHLHAKRIVQFHSFEHISGHPPSPLLSTLHTPINLKETRLHKPASLITYSTSCAFLNLPTFSLRKYIHIIYYNHLGDDASNTSVIIFSRKVKSLNSLDLSRKILADFVQPNNKFYACQAFQSIQLVVFQHFCLNLPQDWCRNLVLTTLLDFSQEK